MAHAGALKPGGPLPVIVAHPFPWSLLLRPVVLTRRIVGEAFVIAGVKNLVDTRQRDPLVAPEDPFGPDFDTNFVWGPTQGRRVMVGFQWNAAR